MHFLGTRHNASRKKTMYFGRGLWKMHACTNNCKPTTQHLVTCSRAWHARENKAACKENPANRPSLNLTSWCAARHLLSFFSISVALAGVWLVCVKWRWDYKHIYCNGLACSPSSLLWLVKCGLTDMELQSKAQCRNSCYFCHFRIIVTSSKLWNNTNRCVWELCSNQKEEWMQELLYLSFINQLYGVHPPYWGRNIHYKKYLSKL